MSKMGKALWFGTPSDWRRIEAGSQGVVISEGPRLAEVPGEPSV